MIKTKHDVFVAVGKVLGLTPAQVSVGPRFVNNKTKGLYTVVDCAVNTTNKDDGSLMVMYMPHDVTCDKCIMFCREVNEFKEKFTLAEEQAFKKEVWEKL